MSFDHLGLTPELLRAVADQGYTEPTPVQREAIPLVLARRDVLAAAQTGTGKTAAFVLPILQLLAASQPSRAVRINDPRAGRHPRGGPVRVLVLTPTRELALQVEEMVRTYGAGRGVRSTTVYGGVGFDAQVRALRTGPQIVVATPGRLLDHVGRGTVDLGAVEILVLDEADRMLDMGFIPDIRRILALLPARRQNLLFSATFSDEIRRLADAFLDQPATVQVAPENRAAELVRQVVHPVDRDRKRELLSHLVRSGRVDQALVFTRTKHGASRLAEQLERDGISATAIHGNKSQPQRVRALDDFKQGRVDVLVATEVAARGLDIEALPHVVNYELPMVPEDYVHRIGRTGRAGMAGDAISLVSVDEVDLLRGIERVLRHPIPLEVVPGFERDSRIEAVPIRQRSMTGRAGAGTRQAAMPGARPVPGRRQPAAGRSAARPAAPGSASRPAAPASASRVRRDTGSGGVTPRTQPQRVSSGPVASMPGERLSRNDGHRADSPPSG